MSQSGLNDAEVQKQIDHMVKFIQNEGREKAEEIDTTAEEDFNIEKVRIVQNEKKAIQGLYSRRTKQAEIEKKIAHSNQLNAARITLLKAQDEHLQGIFAKVKSALESVTKDDSKYKDIVEKLLLQGMLALCEKNINVYCRKADAGLVKGLFKSAIAECKKQTGIDTKLTLSDTDFLPDTCGGGVELKVMDGKIKCTNTLENRLDNACLQTLPAIRNLLFGANPNRAFFD